MVTELVTPDLRTDWGTSAIPLVAYIEITHFMWVIILKLKATSLLKMSC